MTEHDVQRLIDHQRAEDAAGARARERWLQQQGTEDATFVGVLARCAEAGIEVGVRTVIGRAHRGTVAGVGRDFLRLRRDPGATAVLIALAATSVVSPSRGAEVAGGEGAAVADLTFAEALARIAPECPDVTVWCLDGGPPLVGSLRSVGRDVLVVRLDGGQTTHCHVALPAVAEVAVSLA